MYKSGEEQSDARLSKSVKRIRMGSDQTMVESPSSETIHSSAFGKGDCI